MNFSKSIGLLVVSSAVLLGGISFPQESNAKPKCLVQGSVDVNSGSGKPSKHFISQQNKILNLILI